MRQVITLPKEQFQLFQEILDIEDFQDQPEADRLRLDFKDDATLFHKIVAFGNGIHAEVGIFTGQSNAWIAFDLLDEDNCELEEQEIDHDLAGPCEWNHAGEHYEVEIVSE